MGLSRCPYSRENAELIEDLFEIRHLFRHARSTLRPVTQISHNGHARAGLPEGHVVGFHQDLGDGGLADPARPCPGGTHSPSPVGVAGWPPGRPAPPRCRPGRRGPPRAPGRLAAFPSSRRWILQTLGEGEIGRLMADRTEQDQPTGATLHAAISNAVVGLLREYTGRGPMRSTDNAPLTTSSW